MIHILQYVLTAFLVAGLVLIFFAAIIKLKENWALLPLYAKFVAAPWVLVGVLLDAVVLNWIFSWLLLLDMPTQITFTAHCKSLKNRQNIQGVLARSYCVVLDLIIPGHCE